MNDVIILLTFVIVLTAVRAIIDDIKKKSPPCEADRAVIVKITPI